MTADASMTDAKGRDFFPGLEVSSFDASAVDVQKSAGDGGGCHLGAFPGEDGAIVGSLLLLGAFRRRRRRRVGPTE